MATLSKARPTAPRWRPSRAPLDPGQHIGKPGLRIDVVELGSLDQGDVVGQQRRLGAPESLQ